MSVDVEALHTGLEQQLGKGRHPYEAAGEFLWLERTNQEQGLRSEKSLGEAVQVINQWLADKMHIPADQLDLALLLADMYAGFLAKRVEIPSVDPWSALEAAWREWRKAH